MGITTDKIRNITIAGHGGTGKTSLTEGVLAISGAIPKAETVELGRTTSDFSEEEIARKISIHTSLTHLNWKDTKINILDTPGSGDFAGEVIAAAEASESVVILVAADAGVQIETIKIWRRLAKESKPRIIFINKMEKEHADFDKVLKDIREKFKEKFVPLVIPVGKGNSFKGVVDIVAGKAYMHAGGKETVQDVPADMKSAMEEYKAALMEAAAEGDESLMDKYLEQMSLTPEEISKGLVNGIKSGKVVPILCGAALLGSGIQSLLDFIAIVAPSPSGETKGLDAKKAEAVRKMSVSEPTSAFVFKTSIDQFSGKLSFIKICSGRITPDSEIYNVRTEKREKLSKIYTCQGKKLEDIDELVAGDIGILTKLAYAETNDTLTQADAPIAYPAINFPIPGHSVAISAKAKKDEDKLNQSLIRTASEDLTFKIEYNKETKETVVSSMGELHLQIILEKIRDKQKIDMETRVPRVAYRETINGSASAEYAHKKQSGGHGQYAKVVLEIRPIPRGEHFQFVNAIFGGAVSKGYIPGVEKGVLDGMEEGILAGYPVVDIEAKIVDGKEHPVDSSELSFKLAARGALRAAMERAKPVLLEPVMSLTVLVEDQYLGAVLSDLSSKRGKVLGQDSLGGGIQEVRAQVPKAELLRYSIDLKSITSGTASFEMEFDHYSPISGKVAEDVIKAAQAAKEQEAAEK